MSQRFRRVLGWLAVGVSTLLASFWAYWGIIEAFHEGWFYRSLWMNLGLTSAQYLSPMLAFMAACLVAIRWPRAGGGLHAAAGLGAAWFFRGAAPVVIYPFIVVPLGAMGAFYWFGRAEPRRWAAAVAAGVPLHVLIACGIEPVTRVAGRVDDGNREARRVEADGVDLLWAPEGPGWPREGVTWAEAASRCRHLSADGKSLAD